MQPDRHHGHDGKISCSMGEVFRRDRTMGNDGLGMASADRILVLPQRRGSRGNRSRNVDGGILTLRTRSFSQMLTNVMRRTYRSFVLIRRPWNKRILIEVAGPRPVHREPASQSIRPHDCQQAKTWTRQTTCTQTLVIDFPFISVHRCRIMKIGRAHV